MADVSQTTKELRKQNPNVKIGAANYYIVDDKIHVTTAFIQLHFQRAGKKLSTRQITNWEKAGLEKSPYSKRTLKLYDFTYLLEWHSENISKSHSRRTKEKDSEESGKNEPNTMGDIDNLSETNADKFLKIEKLKEQMMKNAILLEEYVLADDVDKSMAEQAVIHISQFMNDKKTLPVLLENKDKAKISKLLEEHWHDHITDLNKLMHKEFDVDDTIYDAVKELTKRLVEGVKMSHIMKFLREINKPEKKGKK